MKSGDLLKHKNKNVIALVLSVKKHNRDQEDGEYGPYKTKGERGGVAMILLSKDERPFAANIKLLEENWEVINET